jgi:flagellar motility protein MotE (MotC chaperone)
MNTIRFLRLLPAVVIAGSVVLALKGAGLVHEARADAQNDVQIAASQPVPHSNPQKDIASDDAETASSAEVDVLSSLARRRAELDARAHDQDMRENVLAATERRLDAKIATLKQLQSQMNQLLSQRDAAQQKQIASLVKTYSAMKPKDAARIFNGLNDGVLIEVAAEMKSDALAPVLAAMNAEAAQTLTVRLASRLNAPDKSAPPTSLSAAAPAAIPPQAVAQAPAAPSAAPVVQPPAAGAAPQQTAAPPVTAQAATHG